MPTVTLPPPIEAYFAAERDPHALASCFTSQAVLEDDGHTHRGVDAITSFMAAAAAKYHANSVPFEMHQEGKLQVVRARVSGNFPGSPIDLSYRFRLEGDLIASLEIAA